LERDIIRERVNAGISNARAKGKRLGRPSVMVNVDRILELRLQGNSLQQIAKDLRIGCGTVRSRLQNALAENPARNAPQATNIQTL